MGPEDPINETEETNGEALDTFGDSVSGQLDEEGQDGE